MASFYIFVWMASFLVKLAVCVCVCVCVCMHVCVCACIHACVCVFGFNITFNPMALSGFNKILRAFFYSAAYHTC